MTTFVGLDHQLDCFSHGVQKADTSHKAKLKDYENGKEADDGCRKFIHGMVEDVWIKESKDPDSYFHSITPQFTNNLISIRQLCDAGYAATFTNTAISILNGAGKCIWTGPHNTAGCQMWGFDLQTHLCNMVTELQHESVAQLIPPNDDIQEDPPTNPQLSLIEVTRATIRTVSPDSQLSLIEVPSALIRTATPAPLPSTEPAPQPTTVPPQTTEYHRQA